MPKVRALFLFLFFILFPVFAYAESIETTAYSEVSDRLRVLEDQIKKIESLNETVAVKDQRILSELSTIGIQIRRRPGRVRRS